MFLNKITYKIINDSFKLYINSVPAEPPATSCKAACLTTLLSFSPIFFSKNYILLLFLKTCLYSFLSNPRWTGWRGGFDP